MARTIKSKHDENGVTLEIFENDNEQYPYGVRMVDDDTGSVVFVTRCTNLGAAERHFAKAAEKTIYAIV